MHQFCSLFVDQYVLDVSVTQTHDVADCGHKTENRRFVFTITGSSFGDNMKSRCCKCIFFNSVSWLINVFFQLWTSTDNKMLTRWGERWCFMYKANRDPWITLIIINTNTLVSSHINYMSPFGLWHLVFTVHNELYSVRRCTYRGRGHTASVSQPLLHPHCGIQEPFHAEIPKDRPELRAHLVVGLQLLVECKSLSVLQWQPNKNYSCEFWTHSKHVLPCCKCFPVSTAIPTSSSGRLGWPNLGVGSVCELLYWAPPETPRWAPSQSTTLTRHCAVRKAPPGIKYMTNFF